MNVDGVEVLLREHGYSASPWFCRCGERLGNAELPRHVAEVVVAAFGVR